MPWKEVTVTEQRQNLIWDHRLNYYGVSDLAERFTISRKTTYKWIGGWETGELKALGEQSRRPHGCPWQANERIGEELISLREPDPGCPRCGASEPDEIWAADYKGQFRPKNGSYCYPLTVSDYLES